MRRLTMVFLAMTMLLGATVVNAQQVEEGEAEPSINRMRNDRSVTDAERPAAVRVRPENIQDAREDRIQEMRERRVIKQESILQLRERQAEEIREKKDAFRARTQEIQDQARRGRAERLADNINRVNRNLSQRYDGFLGAMELVMDKIEIRIGLIEEANGFDLTTVYSMIDEARESIADARSAILEQSAKIYVVDIDSVETMREDFRETMQEMRSDHRALRTEVIDPLRTLAREIMSVLREELNRTDEGDLINL